MNCAEVTSEKKKNKVIDFLFNNWFFIIIFVLLAFYVVSMLFMFLCGLINSLKTVDDCSYNLLLLPQEGWQFNNYVKAMTAIYVEVQTANGNTTVGVLQMYVYTILYAVGCAFLSTLVPSIVAYLTAKFPYKFSGFIVGIVIVTMSLPIVGSTASSLQLVRALGLFDTMYGMWIMSAHFQMGIHFLVLYDAYKGFPDAYVEAAEVDGAGELQIMVQIMMPLVKNIFATVFLLRLIGLWNEYQTPLLYMPSKPTIAYGLYVFTFLKTENETFTIPMQLTGAFLVAIPIFVVFLIFQDKIMANISIGGIKG